MSTPSTTFLADAINACKKAFVFVAIFSCFVNILTLTVSLYMLQIFDRVLASQSLETLIYLTLISIFALGILAYLDMLRSRLLLATSHWLDKYLGPHALERSVDSILQGNFYAPQSIKDISQLRSFLSSPHILALVDAPWVPIYLLVIFLLHPLLGLLATLGSVVLITLAFVNEIHTRPTLAKVNMASLKASYEINAALRNAESIQAMGMLPTIIERWNRSNNQVLALQSAASKKNSFILALSKFSRFTIQIMLLGLGAYLVITNKLTSGSMIAASIILSRALAPIEQSIGVWQQFLNTRSAFKRLQEYFSRATYRSGDVTLPRPQGALSAENLSFVPPQNDKYVLKGVNFQIQPGELLAIIGPSGAGKTTLARLIVGAWAPHSGNVRLDGADVFSWNRAEFGQYIGYLPQNIELFSGTIKENISRMQRAEDEAVIEASQIAGSHQLILHLPNGYDTNISEAGLSLSGGQRQRIGLARALYGNPQLLVLDEPNSNLDGQGEAALMKAILATKNRGATIVIIAHNQHLINLADKILYLDEGQALLFGSKMDVLNKLKELQLVRSQSSQTPPSTTDPG